jgi:hypothetical protein
VHQARRRERMHPRRIGVKSVDMGARGVLAVFLLRFGGGNPQRFGEERRRLFVSSELHVSADVREGSSLAHTLPLAALSASAGARSPDSTDVTR